MPNFLYERKSKKPQRFFLQPEKSQWMCQSLYGVVSKQRLKCRNNHTNSCSSFNECWRYLKMTSQHFWWTGMLCRKKKRETLWGKRLTPWKSTCKNILQVENISAAVTWWKWLTWNLANFVLYNYCGEWFYCMMKLKFRWWYIRAPEGVVWKQGCICSWGHVSLQRRGRRAPIDKISWHIQCDKCFVLFF